MTALATHPPAVGIYSLTWVFQFLYHIVPEDKRETPRVAATMTPHPATGVDVMTAAVLTFPGAGTQGIATAALSGAPGGVIPVRIQGDLGEIQILSGGDQPAVCRPTRFRIVPYGGGGLAKAEEEEMAQPAGGHGMFWEADECARRIRDGELQSEELGWDESVAIMDVLDEIRRQGGLRFPHKVETLDYPVEGM